MLASSTSIGTWIALASLVIMLIPIYVLTLKAANSYGRLEQKVDNLAEQAAITAQANADTAALAVAAMTKLSDAFIDHAVTDAANFGEIRGLLSTVKPVVQ